MKVVIVDDDRLVATSLKTIVESDKDIEVVAENVERVGIADDGALCAAQLRNEGDGCLL